MVKSLMVFLIALGTSGCGGLSWSPRWGNVGNTEGFMAPDVEASLGVLRWDTAQDAEPSSGSVVFMEDIVATIVEDIALHGPDLVALHQTSDSLLRGLLTALSARGHEFEVAVALAGERVAYEEVILIRRPIGPGDRAVDVLSSDAGLYAASTFADDGTARRRGWVRIEAAYAGSTFHLVSTHLERDAPEIRIAQAAELRAGPAAGDGLVHLVGDFDPVPGTGSAGAPRYQILPLPAALGD